MKHLIILGDGMADHRIARLGDRTPLDYAHTPAMDRMARQGRSGILYTIPDGYQPGSEVANTAILGYDLDQVYEGRGPLEAASIGYEMQPDELALRCNIITLDDSSIVNHHGGHLTTEQGAMLIAYLNDHLADDNVKFIPGIQYRHLMIVKGGSKYIECAPPHDHPGEPWRQLMVRPMVNAPHEPGRLTPEATAALINEKILASQHLLSEHPFNATRAVKATSIWPWSGGYRPRMATLSERFEQVKQGSVISAVDLIRGIGHYAGLRSIEVEGATGLADTNYEGKAAAAIEALRDGDDFVFLHIEATDEAGHDGDVDLKVKAIEYLDSRVVGPILDELDLWDEPVAVALLPDHATPVESRIHEGDPVPVTVYCRGYYPDDVVRYTESDCAAGSLGVMHLSDFINTFMNL